MKGPDEPLNELQLRLINDNIKNAKKVGKQCFFNLHDIEQDEVISWAYMGLVTAARRWLSYCQENGFDSEGELAESFFVTYSTRRMRGYVADQMRLLDWAEREDRKCVKDFARAGGAPNLEKVSVWECVERTGVDYHTVVTALAVLHRIPGHVQDVLNDDGEEALLSYDESTYESIGIVDTLLNKMKTLSFEMQEALALHYYEGLDPVIIARVQRTSLEWAQARLDTATYACRQALVSCVT